MKRKLKIVFWVILVSICSVLYYKTSRCDISPYNTVNTIEGVWGEAIQETITAKGMDIKFHNTTERADLFYDLWFCVEVEKRGCWCSLPQLQDNMNGPIPDLDIHIPTASEIKSGFLAGVDYFPDSQLTWKQYPPDEMGYNWEHIYGILPSGNYRLLISVYSENNLSIPPGSTDIPTQYLSIPFTIS